MNIASVYPNSESGMMYSKYLNNTESIEERERKNMVKGMVLPLVFWNQLSLAYERSITYHSGLHFSANMLVFVNPFPDAFDITYFGYMLNIEYRYYLKTKESRFFYNVYPLVLMMLFSDIESFSPEGIFGIGIGRLNPLYFLNERLYLDINFGVGWWGVNHTGFFSNEFFLKPGLLLAYRF
ncbi:MAG: hypothetical protein EA412_11255 [Chitinophagaceae bacterium]|nr:MAG: hypothetical protein EA412_11255 [Chitinophagaceae bacterium]